MLVRRATDGTVAYDGSFSGEELGLRALRAGDVLRLRFDHAVHLTRGQYLYEFNVYQASFSDGSGGGHRLWVAPLAGVRVDEFRTYGGIANLDVSAAATLEASVRERQPAGVAA